jgi:hypothetical protein
MKSTARLSGLQKSRCVPGWGRFSSRQASGRLRFALPKEKSSVSVGLVGPRRDFLLDDGRCALVLFVVASVRVLRELPLGGASRRRLVPKGWALRYALAATLDHANICHRALAIDGRRA